MTEDETPLAKPAAEAGVRALAETLGAQLPADAVVVLQDEGVMLGQPLACSWGPDGSQTWIADYRAMSTALLLLSDKVLREAGFDLSDPSFEREARRLLLRRFPHWTDEVMREVVGALPRLHNLALALDEGPADPEEIGS